jgi:flagellar FliL protein
VALLKNKLVLIIIVVLLLGGGGGAYYFLFMGKKDATEAKKKGHDKHEGGDSDAHASEEHGHGDEEVSKTEGDEENADEEDDEEGEEKEEEGDGGGGGGGHGESKGPIMEPFVVNLADPGSRRYLRVNLKLEFKKPEETEPLLTERMPQVRDAILLLLSSKTADQLVSPEGKTNLRQELTDQLNIVLKKGKKKKVKKVVKNLYFMEFLIQ